MTDPSRQLAALAAGLCHDAGVRVELSPRTWAWDPQRRVILVAEDDLRTKGVVYCAAVLAHEVSHYYISRYHLFAPDFPLPAALSHVLNGIEDPRVNTWIRRRYPGTGRWLKRLTDADGASPIAPGMPHFLLFCLECAREELRGWTPLPERALPDAVAAALKRTHLARRDYAGTLPPGDFRCDVEPRRIVARYREEVWPDLVGRAQLDLPTLREQLVRVHVRDALRIAERDILPVAAELIEADLDHLSRWLDESADRRGRCESALESGDDGDLWRLIREAMNTESKGGNGDERSRELARRTLEAWLRSMRGLSGAGGGPIIAGERGGPPARKHARASSSPSGPRRPIRLPPPETVYERAFEQMAEQIQRLVRGIEDVLRPKKRLAESSGHPTGHRLDLRRVLAFEADPRGWDKLWRRKNIPDRVSAAVGLLVDLSGSMRGPKADAAVAGTVLLAETLHRLQVPFAIDGFQDVLIPICGFSDGLSAHAQDAIGAMPQEIEGCRPGGNNAPSYNDDGPCLREAATRLLDHPADDRLLIVVSDGLPEGRHSKEAELRAAVRDLSAENALKFVGIGLGPDTGHVRQFYPRSIADVPLDRFAEEIAKLLREIWV